MLSERVSTTGRARRVCFAGLLLLGLSLSPPGLSEPPSAPPAQSASITLEFDATLYADVREALLEAIAAEGLATPMVRDFGAMLQRTAGELGHSDALYEHAEIFIFCSIAVAARLATEARDHIAQCPMSIAIYSLPETPGRVFMAYRQPPNQSPGAQMAADTLARIAAQTRAHTFP